MIEDGKGMDGPCSTYNNAVSKHSYLYRAVTESEKGFEDLVFKRLPGSTFMIKLRKFSHENNIKIENVFVSTPVATLYRD